MKPTHDSDTPVQCLPFDAAQFLDDEATICAYLNEVLQQNDPDLLLLALGEIARARGMTQMARQAGVGRESLYKTLARGARPRYDTVLKLLNAAGVRLTAVPVAANHRGVASPRHSSARYCSA